MRNPLALLSQRVREWRISKLSDQQVAEHYAAAGAEFGLAVSYLGLGECIGFQMLFERWCFWEREHAARGFRTLAIDDFIDVGGYGMVLHGQLEMRRTADERLILHAELYREHYLGKAKPPVDVDAIDILSSGRPRLGQYVLPSTKHLV
ncbi:MAG: hypothetical protein WCT10_05465 [Patescibacteria group bacterium]